MKPLIVAEGFDPPQLGNNLTFDQFIRNDVFRIRNEIEQSGYDIVYVDNANGADYVERNAALLREVIERVNDELTANGSPHKNVVVGASMGGVVARIALKEIEDDAQDHNTRLYISFDAPHKGAYAPLSAQYMLQHLYEYKLLGRRLFADVMPQLRLGVDLLKSPAARQMLFYNLYANSGEHASYRLGLARFGLPFSM